jgi:DNA-directed RNA polymerase subunit RPC12/RpoP
MNSIGLSGWIQFLQSFPKGSKIELEHCQRTFIDSVNMVPDVARGTKIMSFYAPYACKPCKKEFESLVTSWTEQAIPDASCPKCNQKRPCLVDAAEYLAAINMTNAA